MDRRRHVDDWRPGASLETLRARARLLARIRAFFAASGVLEVETPLAGISFGTDPAIEPLRSRFTGPGHARGLDLYLQSSPEFFMKRLLAAGSGPIWQLCKAFRDGEAGPRHNPEFTLLEWYRPGFDDTALMEEVAALVCAALEQDLLVEHCAYAALFRTHLGIDPLEADAEGLRDCALAHDVLGAEGLVLDRDGWLDLLMSTLIEPLLGRDGLTFVTDYPASQASLARLAPDGRTAARFELYWQGMELANGFHELSDAAEQAQRFEQENCRRRSAGQAPMPVDDALLAALEHGLPDCVGVALGIDRLLMCQLGLDDIDQVLAFSLARL